MPETDTNHASNVLILRRGGMGIRIDRTCQQRARVLSMLDHSFKFFFFFLLQKTTMTNWSVLNENHFGKSTHRLLDARPAAGTASRSSCQQCALLFFYGTEMEDPIRIPSSLRPESDGREGIEWFGDNPEHMRICFLPSTAESCNASNHCREHCSARCQSHGPSPSLIRTPFFFHGQNKETMKMDARTCMLHRTRTTHR